MPDDDEILLRRITSVRTCGINGEPDRAVLEITSGREEWHFVLRLDDLAALARQLTNDAKLLKGEGNPAGRGVADAD